MNIRSLSSISTVVYSAAPMTSTVLARAMKALPSAHFLNLYGQTECIASSLPPELHHTGSGAEQALRSVGFPLPGFEVRIVDDDGHPLPDGEPGEVIVRSSSSSAATGATKRRAPRHCATVGVIPETLGDSTSAGCSISSTARRT